MSLEAVRPATRELLERHRPTLEEPLLAQVGTVTDGVFDALGDAGVAREHVGFLYLRVADRTLVDAVASLVSDLLADDDIATTVLGGGAIGHRPGALVVGSAVCAGVPDR